MKIIFDLRKTGLGPNGGSLTLIKSGNALHDLGHEVYFVDSGRNQNTWEKLKPPHMIVNNPKDLPDASIIIATGYKSVGPTVAAPDRCGLKFIFARAWETWQMSEDQIVKKVLEAPIIKIVNSWCLQQQFKRYGCDSHIIYPGYDFEQLYPRSIRQFNPVPIIGGLYREGTHGKRKRVTWLFETVKVLRKNGVKFQFWLMGSEKDPGGNDRYLRQPTMEEKNDFFNYVDLWLAPTESEGLHLVPAEAGLTGCPTVGTNAPLSGLHDYLVHQKTGYVTKNNLDSFIDGVKIMVQAPHELRRKYGQAMISQLHEIGDRKTNMKKMIKLFEKSIEEFNA